jgi:hypothetical protein
MSRKRRREQNQNQKISPCVEAITLLKVSLITGQLTISATGVLNGSQFNTDRCQK